MSVIGLMVSLTHLLTRSKSRHAVCDITMSRGCVAPPRHSPIGDHHVRLEFAYDDRWRTTLTDVNGGRAGSGRTETTMEVKGRDLVSGIPKTVRVHSSEIREAIQEPIQQIVDAVRRALEITPPELASDIVDRGIVMTGGGALIRGLDLLLSQETSLPIHVDEDPLTCVVRGTGRILDDEDKYASVLED